MYAMILLRRCELHSKPATCHVGRASSELLGTSVAVLGHEDLGDTLEHDVAGAFVDLRRGGIPKLESQSRVCRVVLRHVLQVRHGKLTEPMRASR